MSSKESRAGDLYEFRFEFYRLVDPESSIAVYDALKKLGFGCVGCKRLGGRGCYIVKTPAVLKRVYGSPYRLVDSVCAEVYARLGCLFTAKIALKRITERAWYTWSAERHIAYMENRNKKEERNAVQGG